MSPWIDHITIALIVTVSAAYAIYSLGPRKLRAKIRKHLLGRKERTDAESGCGSCGDCDSNATKPEAKIPLASIRKELKRAPHGR